jgi:hypothetical protein
MSVRGGAAREEDEAVPHLHGKRRIVGRPHRACQGARPVPRNRFDRAGKDLLRASLEPDGPFESDAEVGPETQRADAWFTPDPRRPQTRRDLGLLYRLTEEACLLEPFHAPPDEDEVGECVRKVLNFRHVLALRRPPSPLPALWIISAGCPARALAGFGFLPAEGWPSGVYRMAPRLFSGLVVVSELPRTRETLLLRLLGAGRVFREAVEELAALGQQARERGLARPVLLGYRLEIGRESGKHTSEDEEFLMNTQELVEEWERDTEAKGVAKGLAQGLAKGLILVSRGHFGEIPGDVERLIEDERDERTLEGWYALVSTATVAAFAAAVRAGNHSQS